MRTALITAMIIAYVAGTVVLVVFAASHPPTGPEICDPVACHPNPNYTPPAPTVSASSEVAPIALPTAGPDAWWRTVNACHLLTTSQARTLGFGARRLVAGSDGLCAWVEPPVPNVLTVSIPLRLTIDLSQYPFPLLGVVSRESFRASDGRRGVITQDQTTGECILTLQATKGSTALIYVSGSARDCELATAAANMISPELPRSGITP
jgi:hypothetical protein